MGKIRENMRSRRESLGMSRSALARTLYTNETQIQRWETKTDPPSAELESIARALNFSVSELLGVTPAGLDLSGTWYAVWDTTRDGIQILNKHELMARHSGEFVYLDADGDYDWRADFRISGSRIKGSYQAVDEHRNESGVMFLTLNHHGSSAAIGRWIGEWADGLCGDGFGVIARDPGRADRLMKLLLDSGKTTITEWPREDS